MRDPTTASTIPSASPVAVVFTDTVLRRFLFGVVLVMTAVVCGVAAAAFWTSFEAIRAFAERSGGINPRHAWLAPLLVDSFIFVASAADLWCSATGAARTADGFWQRAVTWLPKALLGVAAGGSFALNVAHAPTHLGARVVAALAPAALVLTFEILMMIVRRAVAARVTRLSAQQAGATSERSGALTPTATMALRPAGARSALTPPSRPERPARADTPGGRGRQRAAATARLAEVRRLYLDGITIAEEIARRLQIPPSTTRRLLGQVKRELADPAAGGERVGERPVGLHGERAPATDARPPEPDRDDQPAERTLVALTRQGVAR
ncbi:MAG TPA: DUF2637 domain-containing protein [Actinomycetota bacterium]